MGKGKIDIQIDRTNFKFGEHIVGKVVLNLKKNVEAKEFYIRLIANQKISQGYMSRSTQYVKVYDFKFTFDSEKSYSASQPHEYPFDIVIPNEVSYNPAGDNQILQNVTKAVNLVANRRAITSWKLVAKLKVPGLFNDINKKVQISVS